MQYLCVEEKGIYFYGYNRHGKILKSYKTPIRHGFNNLFAAYKEESIVSCLNLDFLSYQNLCLLIAFSSSSDLERLLYGKEFLVVDVALPFSTEFIDRTMSCSKILVFNWNT